MCSSDLDPASYAATRFMGLQAALRHGRPMPRKWCSPKRSRNSKRRCNAHRICRVVFWPRDGTTARPDHQAVAAWEVFLIFRSCSPNILSFPRHPPIASLIGPLSAHHAALRLQHMPTRHGHQPTKSFSFVLCTPKLALMAATRTSTPARHSSELPDDEHASELHRHSSF